MSDDFTTLLIGGALGAIVCYAMHQGSNGGGNGGGMNLDFAGNAKSYVAFGHDEARSGFNNSDVWDTRDRIYFSDNLLYNKLPHIQLKPTTDWDPNRLDFAGAYGPPDMDSPRPRLEHFLDLEHRAF